MVPKIKLGSLLQRGLKITLKQVSFLLLCHFFDNLKMLRSKASQRCGRRLGSITKVSELPTKVVSIRMTNHARWRTLLKT